MLAELRPRRFRTKWQRLSYDGPAGIGDAEEYLRKKYQHILSDILKNTNTLPWTSRSKKTLKNLELLGAGRRASTLRSRVRGVQKFLGWVAAAHRLSFLDSKRHYSGYLQVRLAEPCVRGALKHTHSCYIFLQEVAGVSIKHTDEALYVVTRKEIMVSALPRR